MLMWSDDDQTPRAFPPTREPLSHLRPVPDDLAGAYPDLLHPEARVNIDSARAAANFKLAFEAGDTNFALRAALDEAPLAASTWAEIACAEELFLDEFVEHCMRPRFHGAPTTEDGSCCWAQPALVRLLSRPPTDPAIVGFRRRLLAKLAADAELRQRFEATYLELRALREAFESDEPLAEYDSRQRRFSTLAKIAKTIDAMAESFPEHEEGLGRISAYARQVRQSPGYQTLTQLLDHARELSTVELRLRVNAEGYVTELEILGIHEKRDNPFYRSPIVRALQKFSLWIRGYHASDTVLLAQWFLQVFEGVQAYLPPLLQLLGAMEFYLAALAFKDHCNERGLAVCFPRFVEPAASDDPQASAETEPFELVRLFNPLLFTQDRTPISCDLRFDPQVSATIVTGPNSGGKTRLLQSLAYVHLLGQSGVFAPAASARLRPASALFISLLERASVDQAEGRLGTELLRIRELFEQARPGVLVLLDELCSGTNPQEGEEIFRLVLSLLEQLDARVFVATHFLGFARTLESGEGSERRSFLQVELGPDRLPTYQFVAGVARSSMAVQTAQRLGVSEAQLRRLVEQRING